MLLEEFLIPMSLTQRDLAIGIHVPYQRVNDLIHQRRGMTPSTALRLAKYLGTTAEFWMSLQLRWDLFAASKTEKRIIESIHRYDHRPPLAGD
jgi:addiction module HigA family antidote